MRSINPYKLFIGAFVPNWLMEREEVSHGAKLVYARLAQFAGRDGKCNPKQSTLAASVAMSDRSAWDCIDELKKLGLLAVNRTGLGKANSYTFLDHVWIEYANADSQSAAAQDSQKPATPSDIKENQLREPSSPSPTEAPIKEKSVHHQLIEWWCVQWKLKYRKSYTFSDGIDGKKIKAVRQANKDDYEKSRKTLASYLQDSDPWLQKQSHVLKHLEINKYTPEEETGCRKLADDNRPAVRMND